MNEKNDKNSKKPLNQRVAEANVFSDASLFDVKPSDVLIKSFENYGDTEDDSFEQN